MSVAWRKVVGSTLWTVLSGRFGEARSQPGECRGCLSSPMTLAVVRTGGLDRRVSAFLRVELTHAPAVSNLYRVILREGVLSPTQGGAGVR